MTRAISLASRSLAQQRAIIATADPRAIGAIVKAKRDERTAAKKERRAEREKALAAKIISECKRLKTTKRYGVIYADPPWRFEPRSRKTGMDRAADNHYPTMTLSQLMALEVPAAKDCVLFLWATTPMLDEALALMAMWGFTYKTNWCWDKLFIGTGYWNRNRHELLLLGMRGNVPAPAMGTQAPSLYTEAGGQHSEKPKYFYELIEAMFPTLPKLEMFARKRRKGWATWGAEAPKAKAMAA